jgi:two-component system OmpR family response regulator
MTSNIPIKEIINLNNIGVQDSTIISSKKIIVFLVDDDKLYIKALEMQFCENSNFLVKTFSSGESCLQNLFLKPDVIILDYFLTSLKSDFKTGLEILIAIKDISPETEIIMLSSNESAEIAVNCIKHGAFDYNIKNKNTFLRLKQSIKIILGRTSKEKELIVWDW